MGIGAGNVGGCTIHARIFDADGGYAFGLIAEPFTDVPEGGLHITAAQARENEDLPFVWWVADFVMERDPRALWMKAWLLRTSAIATPQVADGPEPVLLVVHDEEGQPEWQLIGHTGAGGDGRIVHLYHSLDRDPTRRAGPRPPTQAAGQPPPRREAWRRA